MTSGELWQREIDDACAQLPCWQTKRARPKIFFLPTWWPAKYGAWTYFNLVLVGPGLLAAPSNARRYVCGHEYGHMVCGHTLLQLGYWIAALVWLGGLVFVAPFAFLAGVVAMIGCGAPILIPAFAVRLEMAADAIAVTLHGQEATLAGSLWMAEKSGSLHDRRRIERLQRLGWRGE